MWIQRAVFINQLTVISEERIITSPVHRLAENSTMKTNHLFLLTIASCTFSTAAFAQNKNAVHASILYPITVGNSFANDFYKDYIGIDVGYNRTLSKHFSLGAAYTGSLHGERIEYTDISGAVTHADLSTLITHDIDVKLLYNCSPAKKVSPVFTLATGYSILNRQFWETMSTGRVNQSGININPGAALNINVSPRVSIVPSITYVYRVLFSAPDGVETTAYYQNIQTVNIGLGSSVSF
jgi:hypothetical protein